MKIREINFFGKNNTNNNPSAKNAKGKTVNQRCSYLISNPLTEAIGRSLVNFRGKTDEITLVPEDLGLIELIGKAYKLESEDVDFIKKYTADYLKEKGVESLHNLYREDPVEYANETAGYAETISEHLGLCDYESMDLDFLIAAHICSGDITSGADTYKNYRYTRDTAPFIEAMKSLNVDEVARYILLDNFKDLADKYNYDSIFDIFSKDNMDARKTEVQEILGRYFKDDSSDAVNSIMFELYSLAGKTHEQRMENINPNIMSETFEDGLNTIVIASAIADKYGIDVTDDFIEFLNSRATHTKLHQNGKSMQEIAFTIADKYDLPQGAEKEIMAIIEKYNNNSFDEDKMNKLINALISDI